MSEADITTPMDTTVPHEHLLSADSDIEARVASFTDKVYKDECLYCFNSPYSDDGVLICTKTFLCVCPSHAPILIKHEKNHGFVHYKKLVHANEPEEPKDKIQKLSIKLDNQVETEEYTFVHFPNINRKLPITEVDLPENLLNSALSIVHHTSAALQERLEAGVSEWDGEQRFNSENAVNLVQLDNGKKLDYSGWACEEPGCDLKENLWLNLTDGGIHCGRLQVVNQGSDTVTLPGNGHAKIHYERTKYPIVVKLGTVSNGDADVYDYKMDDACKDPKLAEHLAHFGLDIKKMEKTEKSTLEMELDLNQKWEWSRCTEDGVSLESVFGPGFSGIINIGSSCYINSVLQILYLVPDFVKVYGEEAERILTETPPREILESFNAQTAKVCAALHSGQYSQAESKETGFKPTQFRKVVGRGHHEFATTQQQDAEEYLRHFLEKVDTNVTGPINPVDAFRFKLETRLLDESSGFVRYSEREDVVLPVQIPFDEAETIATSNVPEKNRKVIPLDKCLEATFGDEIIEGFKSPINEKIGNAITRTMLKTFPDFLVLQMKRFTYTNLGVVKKLDVDVLVDEHIDLSPYLGTGPKEGENLLPEDVNQEVNAQSIIAAQELVQLGFPEHKARHALKQTGGDLNNAALWLFENAHTLPDEPPKESQETAPAKNIRTGEGKYRLRGIISHMGTSPHSGHYVAHIKRDDQWYIFNDEKCAKSQNPPISFAYLYLLERCP